MKRLLMTYALGLWWPLIALASHPATTVEHVDTGKQTMMIKTKAGQSWTLRVPDPEWLMKHNVQKGDHVSIEVITTSHATKIAKADESADGMGHGSGR